MPEVRNKVAKGVSKIDVGTFGRSYHGVRAVTFPPPALTDRRGGSTPPGGRTGGKGFLSQVRPLHQGFASRMRLTGVCAATRTWPKPALRQICASRASPACAPRTCVPFSAIAWAQQSIVEPP
jgi:hypothetical protein